MWYAVYDSATGALISVGTVLANPLPDGMAYVEYAERPVGVWDPATLAFVPAPASPRRLPRAEFMRLLTPQERIAARGANDPVVDDFLHLMDASESINLDHADTAAGLGYLESIGVLGAGRADEILATEVG